MKGRIGDCQYGEYVEHGEYDECGECGEYGECGGLKLMGIDERRYDRQKKGKIGGKCQKMSSTST